MIRGLVTAPVAPAVRVEAPVSGLALGTQAGTPVVLRVFRPHGTRVAVLAGAVPAQLLALRAAVAGSAIRIATPRPQAWGPLLAGAVDTVVTPPGAGYPPPGQPHAPVLIVDDRPAERGGLGEAGPWQCRLDIRALSTPSDLAGVSHADLLLLAGLSSVLAGAVADLMRLPRDAAGALGSLGRGVVAAVATGSVRLCALDPTPPESQLLAMASR